MSDHYNAIVVVLERDVKGEDAVATLAAIQQIKGVLSVTPNVSQFEDHIAHMRARQELGKQIWQVLYPPPKEP